MTLAAIVITANHYWLDAMVVVVLIAAAMAPGGRAQPEDAGHSRRRPPDSVPSDLP
jgi:hypothetical protein